MTDETALYGTPPPKPPGYPVTFDVTAPPEVSRLSTFFRIVLLIPVAIFLAIIAGTAGGGVLGGLLVAHWISVLIRGRPVGWIFSAIVAIQRFAYRAYTYFFLITDKYPPFEGDWGVRYEVEQPERIQRKQLVIWKTFASIPHFIVLIVLWFAVVVCLVISWFAILFTGRFPLGLRGFVVGWLRWGARVGAYWMSLRDEFPPFSLSEESGPATNTAHVVSGVGGFALTGAAIGGIVAAVLLTANTESVDVSYANLQAGEESPTVEVADLEVTLLVADDDYTFADDLFVPEEGDRFVSFIVAIYNGKSSDYDIEDGDFALKDSDGDRHDPLIVSYGGLVGPRSLEEDSTGLLQTIFEIPDDAEPEYFEYEPTLFQKAKFEFTE